MTYQWFPGHMTKTIRQIEEQIKLIDLIIEIVDARIPAASRNPELDRLAQGRARMLLFGKNDLADPEGNAAWLKFFEEQGLHPYACDLRNNSLLKSLTPQIREACKEKIERDRRKGIMNRPIRAMVAGIPNVGKSTFINSPENGEPAGRHKGEAVDPHQQRRGAARYAGTFVAEIRRPEYRAHDRADRLDAGRYPEPRRAFAFPYFSRPREISRFSYGALRP